MRTREIVSSFKFQVSRWGNSDGNGSRFPSHDSRAAFTLIEVMVVVVLMSVIILGLTAMFTQTQRAFKTGMTQTDVLEAGRMGTEMLARELEQIVPAYSTMNLGRTNFLSVTEAEFPQTLPATPAFRTNIVSRIFFLTRENQTWKGIGYFLVPGSSLPVGVLKRFEMSDTAAGFAQRPWLLISNFNLAVQAINNYGNVSRILDGVVGFNFRAYDTNGYWITPFHPGRIWRQSTNSYNFPQRVDYYFTSNAVPSYVEFELGILEQGALERFNSVPPVGLAQSNYLAQQAGRVHLFRQRVAVRNVDRSAY